MIKQNENVQTGISQLGATKILDIHLICYFFSTIDYMYVWSTQIRWNLYC